MEGATAVRPGGARSQSPGGVSPWTISFDKRRAARIMRCLKKKKRPIHRSEGPFFVVRHAWRRNSFLSHNCGADHCLVAARRLGFAAGGFTTVRAAAATKHVAKPSARLAARIAALGLTASRFAASRLFAARRLAARAAATHTREQAASGLATGVAAVVGLATSFLATAGVVATVRRIVVDAENAIEKLESLCVLRTTHKEQPCCHNGGQEYTMHHGEGSFNTKYKGDGVKGCANSSPSIVALRCLD